MAAAALALGGLLQVPADALILSGLGASSQNSSRGSGRRITVTGRLTGEGVECQAFRAKNGTLYTLTGNLRGFKAGDRVRVVGRVAEISICMQGTTLSVESIRKIK
jgi:hypothetical protein